MTEKNIRIINTAMLFYAVNVNRKNNGFTEIDNPVIASKLGILFALKTNGYVNFKGERVELNDAQLTALQEILEQHFNAEMTEELRTLAVRPGQLQENQHTEVHHHTPFSQTNKGIFNKIKGFLKTKSKVQEELA